MTDLTDRMRTCAAFMLAANEAGAEFTSPAQKRAITHAADLLIEASNTLEMSPVAIEEIKKLIEQPLGEPMEIIPPLKKSKPPSPPDGGSRLSDAAWVDPGIPTLPTARPASARACPKCESRAGKKVFRDGGKLMLQCPVCAATWVFKP